MKLAQTDVSSHSIKPLTNQVDALLVLRAFACLMVVVAHCAVPRGSIVFHLGDRLIDLSWILFSWGAVGVYIFFCLSGYLMGKAFYSGRYTYSVSGVLNFWRNRALRIAPLYGFTILILSLFVYPEILKPENLYLFLRIFTFTYQIVPAPIDFNAVIWSLSVEVQFYLFFPFIYRILSHRILKFSHLCIAISALLVSCFLARSIVLAGLIHQPDPQKYYGFCSWFASLIGNLDIFLIGFLTNPLLLICKQSKSRIAVFLLRKLSLVCKPLSIALVAVLYLGTSFYLYCQPVWGIQSPLQSPLQLDARTVVNINFSVLQPLSAFVIAFFIFLVESNQAQTQTLSVNAIAQNPYRAFEIFGNLSYGVYLWHLPILQKLTPLFTSSVPIAGFLLRLSITLSLSLILAAVTYYAIEIPPTRWKTYRQPVSYRPEKL